MWADFDPREQYIISVDESSVKLWDLEQSTRKHIISPSMTLIPQ